MKILTNGNYVDFEAPIHMDENQLEKFKEFLKHLIGEVEIIDKKEKERFRYFTEGNKIKKWKSEEFILLLDSNLTEEELSKRLDRSGMSVSMQRAQFVPEFISWARSKGYDANKISKTIIEQFLEEKKK